MPESLVEARREGEGREGKAGTSWTLQRRVGAAGTRDNARCGRQMKPRTLVGEGAIVGGNNEKDTGTEGAAVREGGDERQMQNEELWWRSWSVLKPSSVPSLRQKGVSVRRVFCCPRFSAFPSSPLQTTAKCGGRHVAPIPRGCTLANVILVACVVRTCSESGVVSLQRSLVPTSHAVVRATAVCGVRPWRCLIFAAAQAASTDAASTVPCDATLRGRHGRHTAYERTRRVSLACSAD